MAGSFGILVVAVGGVIILIIVLWFLAGSMDKGRITSYIEERGGRVVSITWAPFGKGWFGEKNDRIYEVVYDDAAGNEHYATCKTSMWSGVYWTEDRITRRQSKWSDSHAPGAEPDPPLAQRLEDWRKEDEAEEASEIARLREENARLREEIRRRERNVGKEEDERFRE